MNEQHDRAAWLTAGDAHCDRAPSPSTKPLRLVLLGAPGVGKGTQAELLAKGLGTCHLSTGDVFRAAKSNPNGNVSPAMKAAVDFMRQGKLVPDLTVLAMIQERLKCLRCPGGFLLDGFPRTVPQAVALEDMLKRQNAPLNAVINYDMPIDVIVHRLSGRRTCESCRAVFHVVTRPTARDGICDICNGRVVQRDDDRPEAIRVRMDAYEQSTAPLVEFYEARKLLVRIPADGTPLEIYERTIRAMTTYHPV